jgi:predicted transglutaminase-like cysteine proteinase
MITYNDEITTYIFPKDITKVNDGKVSVKNLLPPIKNSKKNFPVEDLLLNKLKLQSMALEFNNNVGSDSDSNYNYERFLQSDNAYVKSVSDIIVQKSKAKTNDQKMYAIEQWVIENIKYKTDQENYRTSEFWAYPTLTLNKKSGDCEDGAYLMHSLAVAAGIPYERLRTYGGYVELEEGVPVLAGHAWTAYKREKDNEWVVTDWCYWPTSESLENREPMKYNNKYVDDFFYVDIAKTVDTSLLNRIRKPIGTYNIGSIIDTYV